MKVDISEIGGAYQVFVAEDNSSVYVRLLPNDAVGTDGENVIYELWDDMTVRFTHPVPVSSGCIGCGPGNDIFFTDHPITIPSAL